jgi:DNA mismatch endonuclease (patch repair protein)
MAAIRSRNTKPEVALRRALFAAGVRGWRLHRRDLPGCPDLAFGRLRLAVFIDGAFWHGHPDHFSPGKSGKYWDVKIARTRERDRLANEGLETAGWKVIRFWDFEVRDDLAACVATIGQALAERRRAGR